MCNRPAAFGGLARRDHRLIVDKREEFDSILDHSLLESGSRHLFSNGPLRVGV